MRLFQPILKTWFCYAVLAATCWSVAARDRRPQTAQVSVQAGRAGCGVELDGETVGKTDARGSLVLAEVDPGDHYIHVRCPEEAETTYFISPHANDHTLLRSAKEPSSAAPVTNDSSSPAEDQIQLRRLVQQAVQFRGQGRLDEAVASLREAFKLDPDNSDLHRELGITFLLNKEWKRARVEMIEALRLDQTDADAHNGLGYALEKLGDLDGAIKEYRAATHLDPDDSTYRTHYLDALVKLSAREAPKK